MLENNNQNELSHHGIKGQRWGIRRYQNADGSLTPAGRKRVAKMKDEYTELTGKRLIRKPTRKGSGTSDQPDKPKSIKDLSDAELREKINRLTMEKQAKGLENDLAPTGQKFVKSALSDVIGPAAVNAGKTVLTNWFTKVGSKALGLDSSDTKDAFEELKKEVKGLDLQRQKLQNEEKIKDIENKRAKEAKKAEEQAEQEKANKKAEQKAAKEAKKAEREARKAEKESEPEIIKPEKVRNDSDHSSKKEKVIIDYIFDEPASSTALVPVVQSGEDYVKRLLN